MKQLNICILPFQTTDPFAVMLLFDFEAISYEWKYPNFHSLISFC